MIDGKASLPMKKKEYLFWKNFNIFEDKLVLYIS